jgi:hypothetical protein
MKSNQFEIYLVSLPEEKYAVLIQERIARLAPEQQVIAQAREIQRIERMKLIDSLNDTNQNADELIFNILRDMDPSNACEHGRSYAKHCLECGEIDYLMFPELFDKDGFPLVESED